MTLLSLASEDIGKSTVLQSGQKIKKEKGEERKAPRPEDLTASPSIHSKRKIGILDLYRESCLNCKHLPASWRGEEKALAKERFFLKKSGKN